MAMMLERNKKEVKPGAMSKVAIDSGMDLSGFRIGKQRLVSKKKKKSSLKKVILEEREERQGVVPAPVGGANPDSQRPVVTSTTLSVDAPEFVPSAWAMAAASAQAGGLSNEAAAGRPVEGEETAALVTGSEAQSTPPPAESVAPPASLPEGTETALPVAASAVAAGEPPGRGPTPAASSKPASKSKAQAPAPLFVPSWLQGQLDEPAAATWEDGDLPVAQAFEQMKALQDEARRGPERTKTTQQPRGADLVVRHYVHQVLSDELDEKVKLMLGELVRFQERAKERDPLKYAKQKRFCVGIREARRAIARNKAKCLILAPNLEASEAEGGLDETVEDLIEAAREAEVPVIFALSRNRIGKALGKNIRLSIVSVLSADGAQKEFKDVLRLTDELRRQWVLRQMSQMTSEDAEEARRRAEEKAQRDTERKALREQREAERKEEEERKRIEAKAAKEAEKARKAEERKAQIERRRAEKAARLAAEAEGGRTEGQKAEDDRRQAEDKAQEEERERLRREAEERAERERARIQAELDAKEAAARAAAAGSDSDTDSDVDLPAGFNDALF